jgi:hypothetical protein
MATAEAADRAFDILYLQHGAGGDESSWLGKPGTAGSDAKRILDHLMADGLVQADDRRDAFDS